MPLLNPRGVSNIDNDVEVCVCLSLDGAAAATLMARNGISAVVSSTITHPGAGRYGFTMLPGVIRSDLVVKSATIVGAISGGRGYIPQVTSDLSSTTGAFEITFQTGAGVAADPPVSTTVRLVLGGRA